MAEDKVEQAPRRGNGGRERLAAIKAARPKPVLVYPANDDVRRLVKSSNGVKFRKTGGAYWPPDRFTQRRLADGDITLEEPAKKAEEHHEAPAHTAHATHTTTHTRT